MQLIDPTTPKMYPIGSPPWQRALPMSEGILVEQAFDQVMAMVSTLQREIGEEGQTKQVRIPSQFAPGGWTTRPITIDDMRQGSRAMIFTDALRVVWVFCSVQFSEQEKRISKLEEQVVALQRQLASAGG